MSMHVLILNMNKSYYFINKCNNKKGEMDMDKKEIAKYLESFVKKPRNMAALLFV